jgi:hypothetical protein
MRAIACALALLASSAAGSAEPEIIASTPHALEVVIYRETSEYDFYSDSEMDIGDVGDELSGLAMIIETRTIELPVGTSKLVFPGVAEGIVSDSATILGLPAFPIESNFDYDLIAPAAVIAKSLNSEVTVVRTNPVTGKQTHERAVLKTGPRGVLLDFGHSIEALGCSGGMEKLILDTVPEGLTATPTLSMRVRAEKAGRYTVTLAYLAIGMRWRAGYVATLNEDGTTLDLHGWLTLSNLMSTSFEDARTHVLAGNLVWDEGYTRPAEPSHYYGDLSCWPIGAFNGRAIIDAISAEDIGRFPDVRVWDVLQRIGGGEVDEIVVTGFRASVVDETEVGDYKLYTLPGATTVASRQSKQVMLMDKRKVSYERVYRYVVDPDELESLEDEVIHPTALLKLENTERAGLGKAIPRGIVSVVEAGVLAGEDDVLDIPVGSPLEVEFAEALDVRVQPRVVEEKTIERRAEDYARVTIEVLIANDKPTRTIVEIQQARGELENFRVVKSSKRHSFKDGDPLWTFELPPGKRERLVYTIEALD